MNGFNELLKQLFPQQKPVYQSETLGLLERPVQDEIKTPENFVSNGLLNRQQVGKELGLLGLSFAPGAGFSDYAGTYPNAKGGVNPSFQQNITEGNYGTAALQGLGALGDVATTTGAALGPLGLAAGVGVGSIAKAPRAVQRGVQGLIDEVLPKVDELGFFSQVEKSIMDNPQQKGTGQQFLAQLQKTPGVKPEELQYTGLDQFLINKPTVTKGEIQDFLDVNKVQLQEVQLGSPQSLELANQKIAEKYGYNAEFDGGQMSFYDTDLDDFVNFNDLPAAMRSELEQGQFAGETKFSQYTLPGGTNYREVLLTLPPANQDVQKLNEISMQLHGKPYTDIMADTSDMAKMRLAVKREYRNKFGESGIEAENKAMYRSNHYDQPNILAHMRVNDRTVDGKPTMFVEEIQSDWHQTGRKKGYQGQNEFSQLEKQLNDLQAQKRSLQANPEANQDIFGNLEAALSGQNTQISPATSAYFEKITDLDNKIADIGKQMSGMAVGVPDAPFKTSWDELSLKRAIKMASDGGYEQIAFTTGKTQAERYDLGKQLSSVGYTEGRLQGYNKDGALVMNQFVEPNNLSDYVGKELGDKIAENAKNDAETRVLLRQAIKNDLSEEIIDNLRNRLNNIPSTYSGLDLQVGGEGMKGFYDKMLPKKLEKLGKQYGSKPTKTTMQTPDGDVEVWTFNLPKEMRDKVKSQGQPLFQIGAGGAGLGTAGLLATEDEQY
jgi:hypothetical protein